MKAQVIVEFEEVYTKGNEDYNFLNSLSDDDLSKQIEDYKKVLEASIKSVTYAESVKVSVSLIK